MFLATTGNYKLAKRIPLFLLVLYINTAQQDEASWFIQQGSQQRVNNTVFKVSLVYSFNTINIQTWVLCYQSN